jgi:hypothetical protein
MQMNSHLSPEQFSRWLMGERTPLEEQHVRECSQCSAEIGNFQAAVAGFRDSVREWSDAKTVVKPILAGRPTRSLGLTSLRWACIAAMLLLLSAIPIYRVEQQRKAERARADAALLEQVDRQVSRAVAAPMEPLANLMTWNQTNEKIQ